MLNFFFCTTNNGCAGNSVDDQDMEGSGSNLEAESNGIEFTSTIYFELNKIVRLIIEAIILCWKYMLLWRAY